MIACDAVLTIIIFLCALCRNNISALHLSMSQSIANTEVDAVSCDSKVATELDGMAEEIVRAFEMKTKRKEDESLSRCTNTRLELYELLAQIRQGKQLYRWYFFKVGKTDNDEPNTSSDEDINFLQKKFGLTSGDPYDRCKECGQTIASHSRWASKESTRPSN